VKCCAGVSRRDRHDPGTRAEASSGAESDDRWLPPCVGSGEISPGERQRRALDRPVPAPTAPARGELIDRTDVLSGLIHEYHRVA
jgi:hypothetical protein